MSYVNLRRNKKIICQQTSQPWPPPAEMGRHLCRQKPWHVTYRWTHLVNRKMTTYVILIMKLRRNKIEMRSGVVRTVRLSRNSLTPRLSYAACYTVHTAERSHHPPGLISGFSGGKKNINFFFGQNIARVKIVP